MPHFIITRTTMETLGIDVEDMRAAQKAAQAGEGTLIGVNTTINVRPRPETPKTQTQSAAQPKPGRTPVQVHKNSADERLS